HLHSSVFRFTPPPPTVTSTLSLHDALPISFGAARSRNRALHAIASKMLRAIQSFVGSFHNLQRRQLRRSFRQADADRDIRLDSRSEEHTSELQSLAYLVCRLLLEKKKKNNQ